MICKLKVIIIRYWKELILNAKIKRKDIFWVTYVELNFSRGAPVYRQPFDQLIARSFDRLPKYRRFECKIETFITRKMYKYFFAIWSTFIFVLKLFYNVCFLEILLNFPLIPFFSLCLQECQPEFLHDLVLKMKAYIFTPGDSICRKGEVAREMFIIADGILEVISETGRVLTTMEAGDFFGEIGILNLDGLNK